MSRVPLRVFGALLCLIAFGATTSGVAAELRVMSVETNDPRTPSALLGDPGAACGNGILETTEECDDGNIVGGDGCTTQCLVEDGWVCLDGLFCAPDCGDSQKIGYEECDDGNNIDGDGCQANCLFERATLDDFASDDFAGCPLDIGNGLWAPDGAGPDALTGELDSLTGDALLAISVPAGAGDFSQGGGVRLKQPVAAPDAELELEIGLGELPLGTYNDVGLFAEDFGGNLIRVDVFRSEADEAVLFVGWPGGDFVDPFAGPFEPLLHHLRLTRNENLWTVWYSENGINWGRAFEPFSLPFDVAYVGVYAANPTVNGVGGDAFVAKIDYVLNVADPFDPEEDGTLVCDDGNPCTADSCPVAVKGAPCIHEPIGDCDECGDGVKSDVEECDDGNLVDGDGCDSGCIFEVCGNGKPQTGEECDDGNTTAGDGCDANCALEFCGDAIDNNGDLEDCDDGNVVNGDGCDSECIEEICGNGKPQTGEQCDDGNTTAGDGCNNCILEFCGDAIDNNGNLEECDDGNTTAGDGCNNCVLEFCGDGVVNNGATEQCDDGNTTPGDGCDANCQEEETACGNGTIESNAGEECDDGNEEPGDGCENDCTLTNYAKNGDFDDGKDSWLSYFMSASGKFGVEQGQAVVTIKASATNQQLLQPGIKLHPNTEYKLSFRAKSTAGRDMRVRLIEHEAPYRTAGIANERIRLTTEYQTFTVSFTTPDWHPDELCNLRLLFWFAEHAMPPVTGSQPSSGDVVYHIDDVRIVTGPEVCGDGIVGPNEECDLGDHNSDTPGSACRSDCRLPYCGDGIVDGDELCDPGAPNSADCPADCGVSANLIRNPDFVLGKDDWLFYSDAAGNNFSVPGEQACIHVNSAGNNIQLLQQPLALEGDTSYELTLHGRNTRSRKVRIQLIRDAFGGPNYGLNTVLRLTPTEQPFTIRFHTTPGDKDDARLMLQMDPFDNIVPSAYYFDRFSLRKVN